MDLGITGRIALISGADSGMGKETARLLLEAGVRVAVTDKPGGTLNDAVRELSPLGEIVAVTGDVTKVCLLYTSPSPRDPKSSRMPSSA